MGDQVPFNGVAQKPHVFKKLSFSKKACCMSMLGAFSVFGVARRVYSIATTARLSRQGNLTARSVLCREDRS
jgi:hypothetical protein